MKIFKEIISDKEIFDCPISEHVRVLDFNIALQILRMDVHNLDNSFLTGMHREFMNQALQRRTMAKHMLFTPNFCAELFTTQEYLNNNRYIVNKLIGRFNYDGQWTEDIEPLERQTYRKILKLTSDCKTDYRIFFWDRQPNAICLKDKDWIFIPSSPAYKSLLEVYAKFKLAKRIDL